MENIKKENIFVTWFFWQFLEMPKFLLGVWKNYILFALNYLSLPVLLKSLFAPWRRYRWNYPKIIDVGELLTTFFSNVFSRFLGFLMRIVLIIIGAIFQIFVLIIGAIIFLLWLLVPFIIVIGLLFVFFYQ